MLGLLTVSIAWGTTFPLSKALFHRMSIWDLLAVRFLIAAIAMLICFFPAVRRLQRRTLGRGAALGVAYGIAQIAANLGLERTPAGVAGFITGSYVVLTPICAAVILKARLGLRAWCGAAIALTGLAVLALRGFSMGLGEALTLAAALIYALHILVLSLVSTAQDAVGLAVIQILTTAAVCVAAALTIQGRISLPQSTFDLTAMVYMGLVSGALAMIMQSWAQAHLPPSRVAIVMATEPVWAAGLSVSFLDEPFTWRLAAGGALILTALVLTETGRAIAQSTTAGGSAAEQEHRPLAATD